MKNKYEEYTACISNSSLCGLVCNILYIFANQAHSLPTTKMFSKLQTEQHDKLKFISGIDGVFIINHVFYRHISLYKYSRQSSQEMDESFRSLTFNITNSLKKCKNKCLQFYQCVLLYLFCLCARYLIFASKPFQLLTMSLSHTKYLCGQTLSQIIGKISRSKLSTNTKYQNSPINKQFNS